MKLKFKHEDRIIFLVFLIMILVFNFPILNVPYHWDVLTYVIHNGVWYSYHSFLSAPQTGTIDFHGTARMPFFFWILGLAYRIFGISLVVSHLIVLIFSFIGVYFTYLLGSELHNKKTGIIAALLLFFSPLYFAQTGTLNLMIPFTALCVTTLYFFFKGNFKLFLLNAIFLVLTAEPGVVLIISLIIFTLIQKPKKYKLKNIFICIIPILLAIFWSLFYYMFTQAPPDEILCYEYTLCSTEILFNTLFRHLNTLLFFQFNFIISFFILVCSIKMIVKSNKKTSLKNLTKSNFFPIIIFMFLYFLLFSFCFSTLIRHMLPLFPLFFIFGSMSLTKIFTKNISLIIVIVLITSLFVSNWYTHRTTSAGHILESNLEYLDIIDIYSQAAKYIEANFANSTILTVWPHDNELAFPYLGYVEKSIKVITIERGVNANNIFVETKVNKVDLQNVDLIYYSPNTYIYSEKLKEIMGTLNLTLLKRFEKNGKYAEIYKINH